MLFRWPYFCFLAILCNGCCTSHGQQITSYSQSVGPFPEPFYLVNSTIIMNGTFTTINPDDIESISIYKGQDGPPDLKNLDFTGIVAVEYKKKIKSQPLAELAKKLGVSGPLIFALNGHPLPPESIKNLRIVLAGIAQFHLTLPTAEAPATRIDIWTIPPEEPEYPRETIMIRGATGQ